jgi:polysaccharide deacetylase family protein (PEP-CTERM system associated)
MKRAVLSMDVEDWFHLDYFDRTSCDESKSLLDGMQIFLDLLDKYSIKASFFVLGEIAEKNADVFSRLVDAGHDVGSHGWSHMRPLTLTIDEFRSDLLRSKEVMETISGDRGFGYRAPCFSLDKQYLNVVREIGFAYDSSRIDFGSHPLYGTLDMSGYKKLASCIYGGDDFVEFEVSTLPLMNKRIPVSGGGYMRLLPWSATKALISKYLATGDLYVLYIHPFELSRMSVPELPKETSKLTRARFSFGRRRVEDKLERLIELIHMNGYTFTTFMQLRNELVK